MITNLRLIDSGPYTFTIEGADGEEALVVTLVTRQDGQTSYAAHAVSVDGAVTVAQAPALCSTKELHYALVTLIAAWADCTACEEQVAHKLAADFMRRL